MVSGCGLSRKTNRKTNSTFLYFWYYKNGKKSEKYLGRADDEEANLKGAQEMLGFYRKLDVDLHQMISKLESQITANIPHKSSKPLKHPQITKKSPNYLPDFED